jgi:hypothetical protein
LSEKTNGIWHTISIEGEELRGFEEAWRDDIPYWPVQSIDFMYDDAAGEFYCRPR